MLNMSSTFDPSLIRHHAITQLHHSSTLPDISDNIFIFLPPRASIPFIVYDSNLDAFCASCPLYPPSYPLIPYAKKSSLLSSLFCVFARTISLHFLFSSFHPCNFLFSYHSRHILLGLSVHDVVDTLDGTVSSLYLYVTPCRSRQSLLASQKCISSYLQLNSMPYAHFELA